MEKEHPPGPWRYGEDGYGNGFDVADANGAHVASCGTEDAAQLIAQTPELFKALNCLIDHVLHYATMPHAHSDAAKDAANARAVIAKAIAFNEEQKTAR